MRLNNLQASPIVSWAREARRPSPWWLAYLFGIGVCFQVIFPAAILGPRMLFTFESASPIGHLVGVSAFLAMFLALAAWVRFKEGRPVSSLGFRGPGALPRFAIGLGFGAGMITLTVLILLAIGQYTVVPPQSYSTVGWAALLPVLILGIGYTIQSSAEEVLTRSYFIQVGAQQLPGWLAFVLPALTFSGMHLAQGGMDEPLAAVNIVLFALMAGFVMLRQGSLWMACGMHTGWNWFMGCVYGLRVSGTQPQDQILFSIGASPTSQHWISGGEFGPEGSILVTVIWGVATVLAYLYFRSGPATVETPATA